MAEEDFGDFEEVKEDGESEAPTETTQVERVRMPRGNEMIGVIVQGLGGNKMDVRCSDGKNRNCRVPGKYKRKLWLRPKDVVIVVPWEFDNNKADIIYKYHPNAANQLRKKGLLDKISDDF